VKWFSYWDEVFITTKQTDPRLIPASANAAAKGL
jgi:hypothetical protein